MRKVVVTGMGAVSPVGCGVTNFWQSIVAGKSGVTRIDRFDATDFAVQIAGQVRDLAADTFVPPKEQRRMDRFSVYAICGAKMAVADSGIDFSKADAEKCGVAITAGMGGIETFYEEANALRDKGPRRVSPFLVPSLIPNISSGLIAIEYGLKGPNYAVVTACASALHSIGFAFRSIQIGECDVMIAGGSEATITPLGVAAFSSMRALSTRNSDPAGASRPFDKERDGFVMGEGAGILVLEDYDHAVRRGARIYAELAGFGMTCDAFHMTAPCDDGDGARRAMLRAMESAGLNTSDVDYINAHGTSTPLGDKGETLAIKRALGETDCRRVMVSSTKSMTGHLLGGAGGIESLACVMALHTGIVPPTINYTTPDPDCDLDYVPNTARQSPIRSCLNNSFGFGGHNACIAFRKI
ncbi:MAG: beta-ketoacyl-ACP synthase II [bacterium]